MKNKVIQEQPKKQPGGKPQSIVIHKFDVQPWNRKTPEIESWRNALQTAESRIPRRATLYDLYAEIELDGHVQSVTSKRVDAVTGANWQFVDKEGAAVDRINELIDTDGFGEMLECMMASRWWGYSMIEPKFWKDDEGNDEMGVYDIPKKNMRPEKGIIAEDHVSDKGYDIRSGYYRKTIMEIGRIKDLGIYNKIAPYVILKRGGIGDYAMFVQVFGQPIVDAVWDGLDESQRQLLLTAINELGSGGALVRPEGTQVDFKEPRGNATGELQDRFVSMLNREISKAILGTTETTESSSSSGYAQSKTHSEQDEQKHESDLNFIRRMLNSRFKYVLAAHGFEVMGGRFIIEGEDIELDKKEKFEIDFKIAKELGVPVADDYWYENYDIPKPDNYEQIKAEQQQAKENAAKSSPDQEEVPKAEKSSPPSKGRGDSEEIELSDLYEYDDMEFDGSLFPEWLKPIYDFFAKAPAKIGASLKKKEELTACCAAPTIELAAFTTDEEALSRSVELNNAADMLYPELFELTAEALTEAFSLGWREGVLPLPRAGAEGEGVELSEISVDYNFDSPQMRTAWELNLFRFSAIRAAYQSELVNRLFREASNFAEFQTMVKKLVGVKHKHWLETEYNTAYQIGQSAATYQRLKNQTNTFPYWQYKTIGDEKVRPWHRELHDLVLPADHEIWRSIFPPNDWNCRCYVVPRLESEVQAGKVQQDLERARAYIADSPGWQRAQKNGFTVNRGEGFEVFTDEQQYSSQPDEVLRQLAQLTATDWKMLSIAQTQAAQTANFVPREHRMVIDEFWERNRVNEEQMMLTDYARRPLWMQQLVLQQRTQNSALHRFLDALGDVLATPDEVWVNPVNETFNYLKFYRNEVVRVEAKLLPTGDLEIVDWSGNEGLQIRRGLVIKKP